MKEKRSEGFTLIEMMITVAIVAILAAIALPSYRNQILRSNRTAAKTALMTFAQTLERCYTQNSTYVGCGGIAANTAAFDSGKSLYAIAFNPAATATTFTLQATAQGTQTGDTGCLVLTLSQTGVKTPLANCW